MRYVWIVAACSLGILSGCGPIRARPDLKTTTLTLPDSGDCAKGYKVRKTGSLGAYGTQVTEVTNEHCVPATAR